MTTARKATGGAVECWPGFKAVAGKKPGTKGSCEAKEQQTAAERKADARAAAGRKREKDEG